jgi:ribonuclease III
MSLLLSTNNNLDQNNLVARELIDKADDLVDGKLNPFNKNNKLITENKVQNILKKYGIYHNIRDLSLYQSAMVHKSYSIPYINEVCSRDNVKVIPNPDGYVLLQNDTYERLEFLGDAVIENIVVSYLFNRYPDQPEGFMSFMKVNLVNRMMLGHLTRILGLNEYLIISRTLDDIGYAREEDKILCDIFEAFIGAIYQDFNNINGQGYQYAEKFMISLLEDDNTMVDFTELILNDTNYKTKFVKYSGDINKFSPKLETLEIDGEGKDKKIKVRWYHPTTKETCGEGIGNTVKKAEQAAAKDALIRLGLLNG